jgi:hypothetical protein
MIKLCQVLPILIDMTRLSSSEGKDHLVVDNDSSLVRVDSDDNPVETIVNETRAVRHVSC